MTTIRLRLRWPIQRNLYFGFLFSQEELSNLRNSQSSYVQVANRGNTVDVKRMFGAINLVRDVDRYRIRRKNGRLCLIPHSTGEISPEINKHKDLVPQQGGNTLVVLLESPSRYEYNGAPNLPIAPAQGQTGFGLFCHLGNLLNRAIEDCSHLRDNLQDDTKVVISNPIQFEASLLYAIRKDVLSEYRESRTEKNAEKRKKLMNIYRRRRRNLTNAVWRKLWEVCEIRQEFGQRLMGYSPSIIINSCTRGLSKEIRQYLADNENINLPHIYQTHHPSSSSYRSPSHSIFTC